ncbi:hypothetical protein [Gluconacetobacter sp.]|uniref:hypothetical protein n=1 Tax=Gluconacetobacter sp. TaxID=1935994 RepID=UPI0039E824B5
MTSAFNPGHMLHATPFYIDGACVALLAPRVFDVIDPATEAPCTAIALGNADDVDGVVTASRGRRRG